MILHALMGWIMTVMKIPTIRMMLDVCTGYPASEDQASAEMDLTLRWANQALARREELRTKQEESPDFTIRHGICLLILAVVIVVWTRFRRF